MKSVPYLLTAITLLTQTPVLVGCGGGGPEARDPDDIAEEEEEKRKLALRAVIGMGKELPHQNCQLLGNIMGTGGGGGFTTTEMKMNDAQDELREKTHTLGGNYVLTDNTAGDAFGISISGRAFRCDAPPAAAPVQEPTQNSPEERLKKLDELHDKQLITDQEYQERRQEIINSI